MRNHCSRPFKVGDPVLIILNYHSQEVWCHVEKLGRKWATVLQDEDGTHWRKEYKIEIETGHGYVERAGFGSDYSGWHPEDRDAYLARNAISRAINEATRNGWWITA